MKVTDSLKKEITNKFLDDWNAYRVRNQIDEDIAEEMSIFAEDWVSENECYFDAIVEERDGMDEVTYDTDALDYQTYQAAELELWSVVDEIIEQQK